MSAPSNSVFLFAHGAGAGMESSFMQQMSALLKSEQVEVRRFNFSYMQKVLAEGKKRPPSRITDLIEEFEENIRTIKSDPSCAGKTLFIGGKSMGGRIASHVAAETTTDLKIAGLICLGFPFHPPRKPDKFRGKHLESMPIPSLILQGERDPFGNKNEIADYNLSRRVAVEYLSEGDHSFTPRVRSGLTSNDNLKYAVEKIIKFIRSIE